ncbi:TY-Chap domain-containing protein [Actinoplanes couchii]|uniref:TY-Chap N-terminal domain-containing protein n=1 Tax=Actinoplanes couchii TaxID=403638 RepID=A0ABQ3X150_9ACTN|nr:hypothetical protein [Actinoplanes couchii]MDR6316652.1 hypothetical protein [Actinoplanes couchii]GID52266.1 hypothetical protein Aco03nite_006700 [Actinoplanes couchii]
MEMSWEDFTRALAAGIGRGCEDDAVILGWHELGFVQFIQSTDEISVEVSDNEGLPLTGAQRAGLTAAGWGPPPPGFGGLYHRDLPWRAEQRVFDETAQLITTTLRDAIGVSSPADLEIKAFNVMGGERFALPLTPLEFEKAVVDVKARLADLDLQEAAAAYLIRESGVPTRTVAVVHGPAHHRPGPADAGDFFLDRVLLVEGDDPHIMVWSHSGPNKRLGSRLVARLPGDTGPYIRAEQSSTPYVRDLLRRHPAVAADPETRDLMNTLLAGGRPDVVRAERVAIDAAGTITVTRMRLDADEMEVSTLRVGG